MINALLLSLAASGNAAQKVIKKYFNGKSGNKGAFIFSAGSVLTACLFFIVSGGFSFNFNAAIIPYALGFALSYGAAVVFGFLSIRDGSLSLSSLISSYSLTIPTFYGLIFLGDDADPLFFVGFALLMVSLFLINSKHGEVKITLRWVIFVTLSFLGNGICSTVQAAQQRAFGGEYKSEFMILALALVALTFIGSAYFTEREDIVPCVKVGGHLMVICGLANGVVNLTIMLLVTRMSTALIYPIISAGGIILTWLVSKLGYKENLTKKQNAALIFGIISVVLMNL